MPPAPPPAPDPRVRQVMGLIGRGALAQADQLCDEILAEKPDHPQARFARALIDRQTNRLPRAVATLEALHAEMPQHQAVRAELASTRVLAGQHEQAIPVLEEIAAAMPDQPFAHYWLGQAHLRSFRGQEAVRRFERVRELSPEDRNILQPLAAANLSIGRVRQAEDLLRDLLSTHPEHVEALNSLAVALEHRSALSEAGQCYKRVLQLAPDNARAISGVARVLQTEGKKREALELLRPRFESPNPHPVVVATFAGLCETDEDRTACIDAADKLLDAARLTAQDRAALCYACGRLLDAQGRYGEAFRRYAEGGALAPKLYSAADKEHYTGDIIKTFSAGAIKSMPRAGAKSERPVFIVGMPRSGTTLVEQILAAHPDVHAAGELQELRTIWREHIGELGQGSVTGLSKLSKGEIDAAADRYLAYLRNLDDRAARVTDKMPHNFEQLGLINLLFPRARVIHCRRTPLDTCVSCFTVQFGPGHAYSNDLQSLGHAYGQYRRLMDHWRQTLDVPMLDVVYEEVVEDLETQARRIVEFVGLPWDDACLRYWEAQRSVVTASVDQVRKPIYASSVGRWKNYDAQLGPLRDALRRADVDPETP